MESEEFRKKYLMHKVPGIRSMAELAHKLNTENQQLQELQQKMVQLHTDKQNNTKQPFELFNMIQKVEEKLKVAEAEVAEVKEESTVLKNELQIKTEELQVKTEEIILLKRKLQIKTDEAKALKSELAICKKKFEPDLLFGTFYDHTVNWNCNKRQLTKTGNNIIRLCKHDYFTTLYFNL